MRAIATVIFGFLAVFAVNAQEKEIEEPIDGPKIKFEEKSYDFGEITQGDVVEHVFNFTNVGTQPLILSNVQTTCGCTAPSWPREPVAPGESAEIKVKFNSRGKIGVQNKVITISSNSIDQVDRIKIVTNVTMPQSEGDGQ